MTKTKRAAVRPASLADEYSAWIGRLETALDTIAANGTDTVGLDRLSEIVWEGQPLYDQMEPGRQDAETLAFMEQGERMLTRIEDVLSAHRTPRLADEV